MSLASQMSAVVTRIGTEFKSVRGTIGTLTNLTTTAKGDLVSAINEVKSTMPAPGASINDTTASGTTVYSSSKTNSQISTAINNLIGGATGAYDTLKELQDFLTANDSAIGTINAALGNRLRIDSAQTLTAAQKTQGQTNLDVYSKADVGDPATDFVAVFTTAIA